GRGRRDAERVRAGGAARRRRLGRADVGRSGAGPVTRACAALLLCGCVVSGPYRTRVTHERAAARKNLPDELVLPDAPAPASLGAFRVRAWVDEHYRRRPRWRETVEELVGRASRYIAAAFGATLEVDVRAWRRSGDVPIGDMLDELAAADPGDDVDWVIGF